MLDVNLAGFVAFMFGIIAWALFAPDSALHFAEGLESGGFALSLVFGVAMVAASVPVLAILLAFTGTPGKWLCGIKVVRTSDGKRPTLREACARELLVWTRGLGLGFPLLTLFAQGWAHTDLEAEGATHWDRKLGLRVEMAPLRIVGYLKLTVAAVAVIALRAFDVIAMTMTMA